MLKKGVKAWNEWRDKNPDIRPDLRGASLAGVNLSSLIALDLSEADLHRASPEHPNAATSFNNLASLLQDQGDFAGARPLYEGALAICEKARGPRASQARCNLSRLLLLIGPPAEALALAQTALAASDAGAILGPGVIPSKKLWSSSVRCAVSQALPFARSFALLTPSLSAACKHSERLRVKPWVNPGEPWL